MEDCVGYMQIYTTSHTDLSIHGFWYPQRFLKPVPCGNQETLYLYFFLKHKEHLMLSTEMFLAK
jgi:hypothetical protein